MQTVSEQKIEKKSLVCFTVAPQGTLGDPSALAKLIRAILEQQKGLLNITVVLAVEAGCEFAATQLFKNLDIHLMILPLASSFYDLESRAENAEDKVFGEQIDALLKKADGILYLPGFHHCEQGEVNYAMSFGKPCFVISEYDLCDENDEEQADKLGHQYKLKTLLVRTGLAKDHLGIFCTQEIHTANYAQALTEIKAPEDQAFLNLLLEGTNADNYHQDHQLFLGYFNKLKMESEDSKVNPLRYIVSSLALVSEQTRTVDFVLPLVRSSNKQNGKKWDYKDTGEIDTYFNKHPELIRNCRLEFWDKNTQGEMVCYQRSGEGDKLIRFINAFPFTIHTMNQLNKASEGYVLSSGDQFQSEIFSHKKVFLYQTMWWKEDFWKNILVTVSEVVGDDSILYQFLKMQETDSKVKIPELAAFIAEHKDNLLQQMSQVNDFIFNNKNLFKTLPQFIIQHLNPRNYLGYCLKQYEDSDILGILELLKICPNPNYIFDILLHTKKIPMLESNINYDEDRIFACIPTYIKIQQRVIAIIKPELTEEYKKLNYFVQLIKHSRTQSFEIAKKFMNELRPEFNTDSYLNGFTAKLLSELALAKNVSQIPTLNYFKTCLANKDIPLTANTIKALFYLSIKHRNLQHIHFLNEDTAKVIAQALDSGRYCLPSHAEDIEAVKAIIKDIPVSTSPFSTTLTLHNPNNKRSRAAEENEEKNPHLGNS